MPDDLSRAHAAVTEAWAALFALAQLRDHLEFQLNAAMTDLHAVLEQSEVTDFRPVIVRDAP